MEVITSACGSLIAASIGAAVKILRSRGLLTSISESDSIAELQKWDTWLVDIEGLLKDAEEKQTTDQRVKVWLDRLRDLVYDIEDILDEFSTEVLKRRLTEERFHVTPFLHELFSASFGFNRDMATKMEGITKRLRDITTYKQTLDLKRTAGEGSNKRKERLPTSSLVEESRIFGRNDDKEALVQMLLRHEGGSDPFSVIHILGMGGIGKTTLAQLVYNDSKVQACFDLKVWVCVSENFDVVMLTRTILHTIIDKTHEHPTFNPLQENLKKTLSQKKFLLILDDVWEEDYMEWDRLCQPFSAGAAGSKIVITTRKKNVASMAVNAPTLDVKGLLDDECLSLLAIHALGAKNFDSHLNLKDIALEMVKRCKGLPLAAKVLGGLLRNKQSPEDWKRVLRSETWKLPETSSSTPLAVLKLSYDDLPSHLKRCFVYCAIFPKDYEFDRDELVLFWMAESFLQFPQGGERMEDLGIHYFDDLVSRSLFQSSSENQQKYVMHDLIHDLAQSMAGEFCYNHEKKINFNGEQSNSKLKKVRHVSIWSIWFFGDEDIQEDTVLTQKNSLRTVLCFPIRKDYVPLQFTGSCMLRRRNAYANVERFCNLVIGSKCLRVFSLTSPFIRNLPYSIGDLKHLRHLNLSGTSIERLPDSVSSLFNLLTLLLRSCQCLKKLPDKIENLVNLLHLDISDTRKLQEIPPSIGMLTNLQMLSKFVVNESYGTTFSVLKKLNNLRGILSIEVLHNVTNLQDAMLANLEGKQGLEELVFKWNRHHGGLESLKPPHQNLKRLTIFSYGGSEFPSWVSDPSFSKLVSLNLSSCEEIKFLPALHNLRHLCKLEINQCSSLVSFAPAGCPSLLEDLEISVCASLKDFGIYFKLSTSLKTFKIVDCASLLYLPNGLMTLDDNTNPCQSHLEVLRIIQCEKLISFPHGKLSATLKTLEIRGCSSLVSFAPVGCPSLLEDLEISKCASLEDFGTDFKLSTSLKTFKIEDCANLLSLPDGLMTLYNNTNLCQPHLKELRINRCRQLTSFPHGKLPSTLKFFEIGGCRQMKISNSEDMFCNNMTLESIKIWQDREIRVFPFIDGLQSLRDLTIRRCSALEFFPEMELPALRCLSIEQCQNLSSLPSQMDTHLRSLTSLHVSSCRHLESLTQGGSGLPQSLTSLEIRDCKNLRQPMVEWGLHLLSSLGKLVVEGKCSAVSNVVLFPDDDCRLLPTSLDDIMIGDFMNLESLGLRLLKLSCLRTLTISYCPKLRYLAREALPSSLLEIDIIGCPLLEEHYLKNTGEYPSFINFSSF